MANLNERVKIYIIQLLACYEAPSEVALAVKEEFGIKIERSHVQRYDPTKVAGINLSKKFRVIFDETRAEFLAEIRKVPIAHKAYRLQSLQCLLNKYKQNGNYTQMLSTLEQAAKEEGGFYYKKLKTGNLDFNNKVLEFYNQIRDKP
jgi:hypothetical protein